MAVDAAGKATFTFAPDVAWDHLPWSDALARQLRALQQKFPNAVWIQYDVDGHVRSGGGNSAW